MSPKVTADKPSPTTKGCFLPVLFLFIAVCLGCLYFNLDLGSSEKTFLVVFFLVFFAGFLFSTRTVLRTETQNDQLRFQEYIDRLRNQISANLGEGSTVYFVTYLYGHRGIDHYLRWYVKTTSITGMLGFSDVGVEFTSLHTRTQQKFRIPWSQVTKARSDVTQNGFSRTDRLIISNEKYGSIYFETKETPKIVRDITCRLKQYTTNRDRQKLLEQEQINSRNLDAISPHRFEELVGQIFKAMGFQVLHTGGTGDQGVDLVCQNRQNEFLIVQCKRYQHKVSVGVVRDFYGALIHSKAKSGYIITTGEFTVPAKKWVIGKPIILVDRYELAEMLEKFIPSGNEK